MSLNNDLLIDRPCFPSCHKWVPVEHKENAVMNSSTGEIYNEHLNYSSMTVRKNHAILFSVQSLVIVFLRIPYRVYTLFTGDFLTAARTLAIQQIQLELQEWSLGIVKNFSRDERYTTLVRKYAVIQLAKNIAKVVFYPLAAVGLQLASLYGCFLNPWDGRVFYAYIERAFARDAIEVPRYIPLKNCGWSLYLYRISEILGICMQPSEVWEDNNIVPMTRITHEGTLRNRLRELIVTFRAKKAFWINEGINVVAVQNQLKVLKDTIRYISKRDMLEIEVVENRVKHCGIQRNVVDAFSKLKLSLEKIELLRGQIITAMMDAQKNDVVKSTHEKMLEEKKQYNNSWTNLRKIWMQSLIVSKKDSNWTNVGEKRPFVPDEAIIKEVETGWSTSLSL